MNDRLGPGVMSAARSYAAQFAAFGSTVDGPGVGRRVPLDSVQQFIDAFGKLASDFPNASRLHNAALLLGLMEQTPPKLRQRLASSLDAGDSSIGSIRARRGMYEFRKSPAVAREISDFAGWRGLWAGAEPVTASTQTAPVTAADFTAASELLGQTTYSVVDAPSIAAAIRDALRLRDRAGSKVPNVALVITLLRQADPAVARILAQTIHNEGAPGGYIATARGIVHVEKGNLGARDFEAYLRSSLS